MTEAERKEKLNDLMNKISFALKDATLAQGVEIICKRIAELEKELMHLKGCKTCTDRPKGELATVCATEYEGHCIAQKMTYIKELQEENEELKKNALVWHKVTCFDKPDENGYITNDCPGDIGKEFLVRGKLGDFSVRELIEIDNGVLFEDYEWEDVDAWAELPEV